MCSQIMGCASVSSKEMVELLREGSTIEIEVAVPSYYEEEQGTESTLAWTELGSQSNYQEFRMGFDDLFRVLFMFAYPTSLSSNKLKYAFIAVFLTVFSSVSSTSM